MYTVRFDWRSVLTMFIYIRPIFPHEWAISRLMFLLGCKTTRSQYSTTFDLPTQKLTYDITFGVVLDAIEAVILFVSGICSSICKYSVQKVQILLCTVQWIDWIFSAILVKFIPQWYTIEISGFAVNERMS